MAEQIISPGVFTRENDLSFLPQGVGQIGAAIIGPTEAGPAFIPTVVRSFSDFETRFGSLSPDTYVPQTVREYLRNAGSVTVCRVLAGGGYTLSTTSQPAAIVASAGEGAAEAPPSGSITMTRAEQLDGSYVSIFENGIEYKFIASDLPVPDDNESEYLYYYLSASTDDYTADQLTPLVNEINAVSALGTAAVSGAAGNGARGISYTASAGYGATGNANANFKLVTGSTTVQLGGGINTTLDGAVMIGLLYPSKTTNANPSLNSSTITTTSPPASSSFQITLNGDNIEGSGETFSASINPVNTNYLFDYVGYTSNNSKTSNTAYAGMPGYTHLNFKDLQTSLLSQGNVDNTSYSGIGSGSVVQLVKAHGSKTSPFEGGLGATEGYGYASTPFIISQLALGEKELFQFHTLDHGKDLASKYKISILNLKEPADIDGVQQYSSFSVILRKAGDKDKNPFILEQYNNVNLDPNSPRFISRVIGDRYPQYNETLKKVELLGNYPNQSKYVRVSVASSVSEGSLSPKLSPKGFKAVQNTFNTASLASNVHFPSASYEGVMQTGTDGTYNSKGYLGFKFLDKSIDNSNFLLPVPTSNGEFNSAGNFNVENYSGHADSGLFTGRLSASLTSTGEGGPTALQLKFSVPFQGGDDGIAPWTVKQTGAQISATNLSGFNLNGASTTGYKAYKKALDILSNQDEYDINMLAMPGVLYEYHPALIKAGIDMCEERGDTFFVMDLGNVDQTVTQVVNTVAGLDSNYTAVYYPWVKVLDTSINKPVLVPPSVIVPGAIAASDRIGAEWFAPAGLNRGVLGNVIEAKVRLTQSERDTLYNNKINPIATFPQTGVCIWGQKTLQERSTALDRINVRRLLITLKKYIASSSKYLVFEQNTLQTRIKFLNIVNPYLESVQQQQGLFAFRVVMDESNNTPDVIDRNQLVGAIYLQPAKTAEFIILDFNVLPTGATFPS